MILRKKVIIFGLGGAYSNLKEKIDKKYDVLAYTDNNDKSKFNLDDPNKFISPKEINNYDYDLIIVCSSFFEEIKTQLIFEFDIDESKILGVYTPKLTRKNFKEDMEKYSELNTRKDFEIDKKNLWYIHNDCGEDAGHIDIHYFLQDIWAAKKILKYNPDKHYDVASRIDGFISHLLVFREEVTLIDIRPLSTSVKGIKFKCSDATSMEGIEDEEIESLSSLHAIEHFGLGRYGDMIDPEACFKVMKSFQRVMKPNGRLYIGVPIGPENSVVFNAHRIFNPLTVIEKFDKMDLVEFSYIDNYSIKKIEINNIANEIDKIPNYSCGLFEFVKKD
jgi:hypothetical protein